MRTLIIESIDGYDIITGVDRPVIDAISTKEATDQTLVSSAEYQVYMDQVRISRNAVQAQWLIVQAKRVWLKNNHKSYAPGWPYAPGTIPAPVEVDGLIKHTLAYQTWEADQTPENWQEVELKKQTMIAAANYETIINFLLFETSEYQIYVDLKKTETDKIKVAFQTMLDKRKEIAAGATVYFTPKEGETMVEEAEGETVAGLLSALPANKLLKADKTEIDDYRGGEYWEQDAGGVWTKTRITTLGKAPPKGALKKEDLSDEDRAEIQEQAEQARIEAMTGKKKKAEYDQMAAEVLARSVSLRSQYEIQGVEAAQALIDAQTWYNNEIADLQTKYDIQV